MRWRLRTQLLLPVALLLVGVAGITVSTALAAASQARQQIEARLREVARFLVEESHFPLTPDVLRQLVRRGLIAVVQRGQADRQEVAYGTTPRFLELFGLTSLEDLPRTQDLQQI